jgi:manganese/zinc/iron transport system permease protein
MNADIFLQIDLPALLLAVLAALACALPGNFLVLRKQAMMGDALSHVVLPGLVVAFLFTGTLYPPAMMLGAAGACLLAVWLIRLFQRSSLIDSGAAMGIVFTAMFALGLLLLESRIGSRVHLDAKHALYGALELTYWPAPLSFETLPAQIKTLIILNIILLTVLLLFFKELRISSFDPEFSAVTGLKTSWIGAGLMLFVALTAVACFESVGSILVIALFVCPAATARMLCDDLRQQVVISALCAVLSALLGYMLASLLPRLLGFEHSLSAAGMIALSAGGLQLTAMLFAPRYGTFRRL